LLWDEVEAGSVRQFRSDEVLERVSAYGDLLAPLLDGGPRVP
jgi:bifunctional non-homologous end joining protein LigD